MPARAEGEIDRFEADRLTVRVFANGRTAGRAAASDVAEAMRELATLNGSLAMVFASAPSQLDLLEALGAQPDLPWQEVRAFHLDEYVGIDSAAPQSFARFLRERLFDKVEPGEVHYLDARVEPARECDRYAALLREHPLDLACIGIGENGHIAFNEPEDTDFDDERLVRLVTLDERSRHQQVNEGLFPSLEAVPRQALTLTVPAITAASSIHCIVPGARKAQAVKRTLEGVVTPECPASVLRRHPHAVLYLDSDSASLLDARGSR